MRLCIYKQTNNKNHAITNYQYNITRSVHNGRLPVTCETDRNKKQLRLLRRNQKRNGGKIMRYISTNDFEVLNNSEAVISGDNGVVLHFDYSAKVTGGGVTSNGFDIYDIDDVEIEIEVKAKNRKGKPYKNHAVIEAAKERIEKHILKYFDNYTD